MELGVRQELVKEGVGDTKDPGRPSAVRSERHHGLADHGRAMGSATTAMSTLAVRLC